LIVCQICCSLKHLCRFRVTYKLHISHTKIPVSNLQTSYKCTEEQPINMKTYHKTRVNQNVVHPYPTFNWPMVYRGLCHKTQQLGANPFPKDYLHMKWGHSQGLTRLSLSVITHYFTMHAYSISAENKYLLRHLIRFHLCFKFNIKYL
jgi:hypothetical protein